MIEMIEMFIFPQKAKLLLLLLLMLMLMVALVVLFSLLCTHLQLLINAPVPFGTLSLFCIPSLSFASLINI